MDIKCLQCKTDVRKVTKARVFCSEKCRYIFNYIPKKGGRGGKWGECGYCQKAVWLYPRHQKKKKGNIIGRGYRFCNKKHYIFFIKQKSFHKNCEICGKIFYCQPCQIKYRHRKTCSILCRSKLQQLKAKENRIKNGFTKHQIDRCIRYSKAMKEWRKAVFKRDNWTCQNCKIRGSYLEADHIKSFAYYPKLRFEVSNGRTLCRKCHMKTDTWGYRKIYVRKNKTS